MEEIQNDEQEINRSEEDDPLQESLDNTAASEEATFSENNTTVVPEREELYFSQSDDNSSNNTAVSKESVKYNSISFITANARSLCSKLDSLVDNFDELSLHVALITETWFRNNKKLESDLEVLGHRDRIKFISRPRQGRGGGVSIAYDPSKIQLQNHRIENNIHEVVCAKGQLIPSGRKVVVVCVYIPPKQSQTETSEMMERISDNMVALKIKLGNPIFIIGGDINKRDVTPIYEDLPGVRELPSPPTRGWARLDVVAANFEKDLKVEVLKPLESVRGADSDHGVLYVQAELSGHHHFTKSYIFRRKMNAKNIAAFRNKMIMTDWNQIATGRPNQTTERFSEMLESAVEECFPERRIVVKSSDKPWMNQEIRRAVRRRKRCFKKSRRSGRWRKLKKKNTGTHQGQED